MAWADNLYSCCRGLMAQHHKKTDELKEDFKYIYVCLFIAGTTLGTNFRIYTKKVMLPK